MKVLSILAVLVGSALCSLEPAGYRTSSTYLPPNTRSFGSSPSPSSTYVPPHSSRRHQDAYSAVPNNYQRVHNIYQVPSYQQPQRDYNSPPSSTYLPPSSSSLPSNIYEPPKDSYSLPDVADMRNANVPAASYGVPEYNSASSRGYQRHNYEDDYSSEPAKYDFAYRVNDNFGNDYGHRETRNGAKTRGSYSVLLPDGRKQIVEYEADEAGYRPKLSYEDVQTDRAAYSGDGPY